MLRLIAYASPDILLAGLLLGSAGILLLQRSGWRPTYRSVSAIVLCGVALTALSLVSWTERHAGTGYMRAAGWPHEFAFLHAIEEFSKDFTGAAPRIDGQYATVNILFYIGMILFLLGGGVASRRESGK